MTDFPAEYAAAEQGESPRSARSMGILVNWAGAAVSLALVAGTCVWGYKLLVRDVSGVPVVRAVEGPMRTRPEDPGGQQAAHQGLAVNAIAADGEAAGPTDRVILAPPPINLGQDDLTATPVKVPATEATVTADAPPATETIDIEAPAPLDLTQLESIEALADKLASNVTPLAPATEAEETPVKVSLSDVAVAPEDEAPTAAPEEKPEIIGGLKRSLRPQVRPAGLAAAPVQVASTDPIAAAPTVTDPETIPAGTHMVQLGAFASTEIAAAEWNKMNTRYEDYLGDKTRVIQKARSGGRDFYRLRAMGFADLSDARRLCSALKAEGADCIPVTTR
ncbi:SPOR domain-containing protein [Shimia sp. SDUM112013]|uniref:SPOR domain-containing protein n=1 Tax=Shimia sp. SDUM112013 TaxID=3136160 RepID=UPI0032EDF7D4